MTSSNGNIFPVTGPLYGELTGDRWIPHAKASDAELWCWYEPEKNGWVNSREAGDLRGRRVHYDVIVMFNDTLLKMNCMPLKSKSTRHYRKQHSWSREP